MEAEKIKDLSKISKYVYKDLNYKRRDYGFAEAEKLGYQYLTSSDTLKESELTLHAGSPNLYVRHKLGHDDGFFAVAFKKDDELVIAIRGSDELSDWTSSNINIIKDILPSQFVSLQQFTDHVIKEYGEDKKLSFTGHSLGGALSNLAS